MKKTLLTVLLATASPPTFADGSFFQPYLFDYPTRRDFGVPLEEIEGVMGREIQPAQRSPSEFERRYLDIEFGDVVFVDGEK